ncbi:Pkinase-domain-containing protein [Hortaea werneckii]|uniref:Protein kinase domain-containing protein n=1 Tax=Hortaea werneckii TaxID=91943 RepID=A0A3M7ERD4_HORWE|nr:Pkinase-domain-containing protein [Hortaea werneckii]KAI6854659.1 Pkinase-domain-containing protein [Hortaea werneckii]KAI7344408.1 Pkinase-domain-containing protein [Hortaea werneckii]RMY79148.1 hypothetical protein D0862_13236 [Hortaea werneckii]
MASPVPLLRPPIPGQRSQSGNKVPRLGLAIPASPNQRPVNGAAAPPLNIPGGRPGPGAEGAAVPPLQLGAGGKPHPPKLSLATPMGSSRTPEPGGGQAGRRPALRMQVPGAHQPPGSLAPVGQGGGSSDDSAHSRRNSLGGGPGSVSTTASDYGIDYANVIAGRDPDSAAYSSSSAQSGIGGMAMEREGSTQGATAEDLAQHLKDLHIRKGNNSPLDAPDLDDLGWKAAKKEGRIIELGSLGEGAGGAVTRCILKGGRTIFALKIITTDPNPDVKKQIVRELSFNKSCASAHICQYYGAFMDDTAGTIGISMEFCEGGSLDSVYREVKKLGGRTGEKVLGKVAEGVLNGLTYLHSHRIIHRDIKPSNILLTRSGLVKLCDFGVSGEFGTKGDANTFIGTSYYMAPERITGQSYTITSDVWSLGVTLLEVAQHRFPFPADGTEMMPRAGLIDLLTYIVRQPIPKLKDEPERRLKWSEGFKYFIECCLEKEGNKRATPWRMLEHPWMLDMKTKRVDMQQFLRTVWDWQEDQQPALTTAEGVNLQEGGAAAAAGITSEPPGNAKVVAAAAAGETVT